MKRGQLCLGPLLRKRLWRWTLLQMSNAATGTSRTAPEARDLCDRTPASPPDRT